MADEQEIDELDSEYGDGEEFEDNPNVFKIRCAVQSIQPI